MSSSNLYQLAQTRGDSDVQDTHLHATLERIDQLANEDVEMQCPPSEALIFLVLDTNILLHHFDVIQQFVVDVESQSFPIVIVIPGAVINELDGQKNRDGLAWFARRASGWLLKKVKERKTVKGQAREETCKRSGNWKDKDPGDDYNSDRTNDYLILDCALYYQRNGRRILLCSADRNLCFDAEAAHIPSLLPSARWSSQELAHNIFGLEVDVRAFGAYRASYRDRKSTRAPPKPIPDDDLMDIDDDDAAVLEDLLPSHELDLLHLQIIEHVTRLFVELIGRVGGPEVLRKPTADGVSASVHAAGWSKKYYTEWSAQDCLQYLDTKKPQTSSWPRLDVFLAPPYSGRGARRGQDWARGDWDVALEALRAIGDSWQESSIGESLVVLQPHLDAVFDACMRPTGIGNTFG